MWYRTGTVAINNGSATVTGTGTAFVANATIGEGFLGPDGRIYEITAIASNTSLTIAPNYLGSNVTGQAYAIAPLRGRIADLITETSTLLSSFAPVRDGIGAGLFPDGGAVAPAMRFSADQDTGLYRPGNNVLAVASAGAEVARFDENSFLSGVTSRLYPATGRRNIEVNGSSGAVLGLGVSGTAAGYFLHDGTDATLMQTRSGALRLGTNGTNRLHILASGAVGIGTSTPATTFAVSAGGNNGIEFDPSGGFVTTYNRGTSVFTAMTFRGSSFAFQSGGAGNNIVISSAGHITPGTDNGQQVGTASLRFSTVFAATGTINTSDERDKHWRGALTVAELRAAKRIIAELGIYQWNDAVAEKGQDDARLHFGVRAQQAFAVMDDEGLDWSKYAWACYDEWDEHTEPVLDDEGAPTGDTRVTLEAGDRYGIRPDQLAFWLIAAQAAMQADLDARLTALETS
jgi:hypothetical protein